MNTCQRRFSRLPRTAQQGVALIVALVMLVVIGLTSMAVMRGSLSADLVANNARVQTLASQQAQIALRYCERQLIEPDASRTITIRDQLPVGYVWESFSNWFGAGKIADEVPAGLVASGDSSFVPATTPQCLAERNALPDGKGVFIVTARGFSPDFSADTDGRTLRGSVVWLQSTVRLSKS
jgi:type IV pilus assembly protein PilX